MSKASAQPVHDSDSDYVDPNTVVSILNNTVTYHSGMICSVAIHNRENPHDTIETITSSAGQTVYVYDLMQWLPDGTVIPVGVRKRRASSPVASAAKRIEVIVVDDDSDDSGVDHPPPFDPFDVKPRHGALVEISVGEDLKSAIIGRAWDLPKLTSTQQLDLLRDINTITISDYKNGYSLYKHISTVLQDTSTPGVPLKTPPIYNNKSIITFAIQKKVDDFYNYIDYVRGKPYIHHLKTIKNRLFFQYVNDDSVDTFIHRINVNIFMEKVAALQTPMLNFKSIPFDHLAHTFHHVVPLFYAMLVHYFSQTSVSLPLEMINHIMTFLSPFDCFAITD